MVPLIYFFFFTITFGFGYASYEYSKTLYNVAEEIFIRTISVTLFALSLFCYLKFLLLELKPF